MKFHVSMTARAEADLCEIADYIATGSPLNASRWLDQVANAIERLEEFPSRCRRAPESEAFQETVRQLILGNYRILFAIREKNVVVLSVRHAARRPLRRNEL